MSMVMLMIAGWAITIAMIGFYALQESGKLLKVRHHIALRLETLAVAVRPSEEGLQAERENVA